MKTFIKKKHLKIGIPALIVVLIALFVIFGRGREKTEEVLVVHPGEFVQEVSVSGKVIPAESVDLAFPETGKVAAINVKVGDEVREGALLGSLTSGSLYSDLQKAEADLAQKRAEAKNTEVNLDEVIKEQDTLVSSAYRKLLSEGLVAVPSTGNSDDSAAPSITGLYNGREGIYKISIERGNQLGLNEHLLRTFDLENTEPIKILEDEPTNLGTKGLFISFPDDLDEYDDTIWYVNIPNKKSSSYLGNENSYQEALRARDKAISTAKAELERNSGGSAVKEAEIQRAEAEVARVKAEIGERILRAPFLGIVTAVDIKVGEIASSNQSAISLASKGALQIESFVPEINIPFIKIGDNASVTLDAYGIDVIFEAKVVSKDPAETIRDGVSTYRTKLQFIEQDERVKSGMTASIRIVTEKKSGVISVPQGIIENKSGKKFVKVKIGEKIEDREVTTGLISSLGEIEITGGLSDGDMVIIRGIK